MKRILSLSLSLCGDLKMNYRIKLVLALHVSLDEEDVVDGLLNHKGKSSRLRCLRPEF